MNDTVMLVPRDGVNFDSFTKEDVKKWAAGDLAGVTDAVVQKLAEIVADTVSPRQVGVTTRLVYGTQWNAMLYLVINALKEDNTSLGSNLREYLEAHLAPPNTLYDIEVSEDVVRLIKHIAPATTLTEMELSHVQDECDIILRREAGPPK